MNPKRFLISSLALAGLIRPATSDAALPRDGADANKPPLEPAVYQMFRQDHLFSLASHSSHRSHSSHSSHRSGSGGSYYPSPVYSPPAPVYTPAPARAPSRLYGTSPTPSVSSPSLPSLSGRTELFNDIVRRVQLGLQAFGYYEGTIDGVVGPGTKAALRQFQEAYSLKVTGTITPQVLDTLKIAAR